MPAQGGGMEIIMAYKIKLSVFILIIMLFPINIYAWSGVSGIEWLKDTPSENIFRIEGSPRKFILLDRTDDKDPTFFIFTKECYADRAFDSNRPKGRSKSLRLAEYKLFKERKYNSER